MADSRRTVHRDSEVPINFGTTCAICGRPSGLFRTLFASPNHPHCEEAKRQRKIAEREASEQAHPGSQRGGIDGAAHTNIEKKRVEVEVEGQKQPEDPKNEGDDTQAVYRKMLEKIQEGRFEPLNDQSEIMLDERETLCALFKGCWSTLFYPRAAGRVILGGSVRVDGLKQVDFGSLHITDKRICFVGRGGAKVIPLKKVLQCEAGHDTLHVTALGRSSSAYFIIESSYATHIARAAILKLVEMAKGKTVSGTLFPVNKKP